MMKLTVRRKVFFLMVPIFVVMSLVYTFEAIRTEKGIMRAEIIKRAEAITTLATKTGELPVLSGNPELLRKTLSLLKGTSEVSFVAFYDNKKDLLMYDGSTIPRHDPNVFSKESILYTEGKGFFDFYAPIYTIRPKEDIDIFQGEDSASPIKEVIGWARIGFSKAPMRKTEQDIVLRGLLFALIFALGGGAVAYLFISLSTRSLAHLSNAVKRLEKGEYQEISHIASSDEIGALATEFNRMGMAVREREGKLQESSRRIKELFNRVNHAIFRLDRQGAIVESNRTFNQLCGKKHCFEELFADGEADARLTRSNTGGFISVEERIMDSGGNELIVTMSLYPECDENGAVKGYDGYFVDISETKKMEEILVHSQKLESIGFLAGGIAHDFNNILTGILGYSSLMKSSVPEAGHLYKYVDAIEKSAVRAANLANQLLGFARKGKYKVEMLDVNTVTRELVEFLKETFDRNIEITLDMEEALPPIEGDSNQLYQALLNLCINSRDAMPEGGKLFLKTETCVLEQNKISDIFQISAGTYIRISITDTGIGIPPEVKKKIFDPFYTTKDVGKGTGLGLAMVYGIVKNHGGYIIVNSAVGFGTTFNLYLPRAEGEVKVKVKEARRDITVAKTHKKGTILIIDDEETMRELGKDVLEAYQYTVFVAAHGSEGVRIFEEKKDVIDLVILDMVMPEKGGKQTYREIKDIKPEAKVLLCSGYGEDQYFRELYEAGIEGFLKKPFKHTELLAMIEEIIGTAGDEEHNGSTLLF